jgi:hypothetical protein
MDRVGLHAAAVWTEASPAGQHVNQVDTEDRHLQSVNRAPCAASLSKFGVWISEQGEC